MDNEPENQELKADTPKIGDKNHYLVKKSILLFMV